MTDQDWMQIALSEAARAPEHGDIPVGALVVSADGELLATAHNRREIDGDPTAHAEILALRAAANEIGHWRLLDATLYVTLEPCAMCAGALVNARIKRLVFGAVDTKAGAIESLYRLGNDERLNHRFEVTANVESEAAREQLQAFFRKLRAEGQK